MPQAVNGMLIGLMGFMSTSPNELLPNELGLFISKPVCQHAGVQGSRLRVSPAGSWELELGRQRVWLL